MEQFNCFFSKNRVVVTSSCQEKYFFFYGTKYPNMGVMTTRHRTTRQLHPCHAFPFCKMAWMMDLVYVCCCFARWCRFPDVQAFGNSFGRSMRLVFYGESSYVKAREK